jgi:hypothetical protein
MQYLLTHQASRVPWNKGKITGQKPPLMRNEIWAIRVRLQIRQWIRDLALFNLAIDSKLRACDLVRVRVRDVTNGSQVASRAIIMQRKTKRPVQFEITEQTRADVFDYIERFYNRQRRHSYVGNISPAEFEERTMLA